MKRYHIFDCIDYSSSEYYDSFETLDEAKSHAEKIKTDMLEIMETLDDGSLKMLCWFRDEVGWQVACDG